jgi:F-type H+-transporting ATPase subunit c
MMFGLQEAAEHAATNWVNFGIAVAVGFGMAIAVIAGALGQSRAVSAAVEATARQPEAGGRIFTAMVLGLAFIETLVIFTFALLGFFLLPKFAA